MTTDCRRLLWACRLWRLLRDNSVAGGRLIPTKVVLLMSLADKLAKWAGGAGEPCPPESAWDGLRAATAEHVAERLWLLPRGGPTDGLLPPMRDDGTWSAPNAFVRLDPATRVPHCLRSRPTDTHSIPLDLRIVTCNTLSARGFDGARAPAPGAPGTTG